MRAAALIAFAFLSAPALAQEGLVVRAEKCADISDTMKRHACFDALVPDLKKAEGAGAAAAPAAPAPASKSELQLSFAEPKESSLTAKSVKPAPKADRPPEVNKASFNVKAIDRTADGSMIFTMENGQVWQQIDTVTLHNLGRGPWTAEIQKAAMGSYLLTIGKTTATVRVKRVE